MRSIVIYATRHGNTKKVAESVADGLRGRGPALAVPVEDAAASLAEAELIVIGGPAEQHGMTEAMAALLGGARADVLRGKMAAAFDTRLHWPRWLSGSAGADIARKLRESGARVIVPEESFFVGRTPSQAPVLEPGELERAVTWARSLAERAATAVPTCEAG